MRAADVPLRSNAVGPAAAQVALSHPAPQFCRHALELEARLHHLQEVQQQQRRWRPRGGVICRCAHRLPRGALLRQQLVVQELHLAALALVRHATEVEPLVLLENEQVDIGRRGAGECRVGGLRGYAQHAGSKHSKV